MQRILNIILMDAKNRRDSAGMQGSMHDGGAGELEMQVRFYRLGAEGRFPEEWRQYKPFLDPDYETYLRLKRNSNRN